MVRQAPAGHDRPAAGNDAGHALRGQRHKRQAHAGVDGHVVHALLALLDDRVAEDLPGQVLSHAIDLLQCLVDRNRADRDGGVAQDPLAGGVDVVARGQVHHGVGTPAGGPAQLVHLLADGRGDRGVANVGVDLGQKRVADDHRLALRVVHVVRDDRLARGDLLAHLLHVAVLAQRHELHLRGDLPAAGVRHLRHALAFRGAQRRAAGSAPLLGGGAALGGTGAVVKQIALASLVLRNVAAGGDPLAAQRGQALFRLRPWAAGAVELHGLVRAGGGVIQRDRGLGDLESVLTQRCVAVLAVDFLSVGVSHDTPSTSFAGANRTGSDGARAACSAISAPTLGRPCGIASSSVAAYRTAPPLR